MMIHMIGFGSQGSAWAQCLQKSGRTVRVFLHRKGPSYERAQALGLDVALFPELAGSLKELSSQSNEPALIPMLIPDLQIGPVYRDILSSIPSPLTLVLAHGYSVYSGDLKNLSIGHEATLLAPKAIGPKILFHFEQAKKQNRFHELIAAVSASKDRVRSVIELARNLGFAPKNIVETTFEKETVGDLVSEQGLLCGGVFTLMLWTLDAMEKAGIPPQLIREECFSELELIAGLVSELGPAATWDRISEIAKVGTIAVRDALEKSNARELLEQKFAEIQNGKFIEYVNSRKWNEPSNDLRKKLIKWQEALPKHE